MSSSIKMDVEKIKRIFYSNNEPYYTAILSHDNNGNLSKYGSAFHGQKGFGVFGDFSKLVIPVRIQANPSQGLINHDEKTFASNKRVRVSPLKSDNRKMLAGAGKKREPKAKKLRIVPPLFKQSL